MTVEEAIRILDPSTTLEVLVEIEYYGGFNGMLAQIKACEKACEIACEALRAQQEHPMAATQAAELRSRLADYEDAEEQGLLVRLPCKRGDKVWRICGPKKRKFVAERTVLSVTMREPGEFEIFTNCLDWLGKTVFLAREEAEAALKEENQNG